jgi:hypothetical protein
LACLEAAPPQLSGMIDLSTVAGLREHQHQLAAYCPRCDAWRVYRCDAWRVYRWVSGSPRARDRCDCLCGLGVGTAARLGGYKCARRCLRKGPDLT